MLLSERKEGRGSPWLVEDTSGLDPLQLLMLGLCKFLNKVHLWVLRFDPLVVPTLVDNLKKRVIVDSLNIMNYIDQVSVNIHLPFLFSTML